MIYGDWEDGYEQLPVLFNAIKAVNPGMHYEYIPKPNTWKDEYIPTQFAMWPHYLDDFILFTWHIYVFIV